ITANQFLHGSERLVTNIIRDISDRRQNEEKFRLAATVFEHMTQGVLVCDVSHRVTAVNPAFSRIVKLDAENILGMPPLFLAPDPGDGEFFASLWGELNMVGQWDRDVWHGGDDNTGSFTLRLHGTAVRDDRGTIHHYVIMATDISEPLREHERIRYETNFDALTGLPNRALFLDRLSQALAGASRGQNRIGVMFIHIDAGQAGNNTLDQDEINQVYRITTGRLSRSFRPYDTVARLGGDEFAVIMPNLEEPRYASVVATRVVDAFSPPFVISGSEIPVTTSIGIAVYPDDGPDVGTLLNNAKSAMDQTRQEDRAGFRYYDEGLDREARNRLKIWYKLEEAFAEDEFSLYYQPRVDLLTGCFTGVESLLRWSNKELGPVRPCDFIPAIEEAGRMDALGERIIEMACRQLAVWNRAGNMVRMSINLSNRQLRHPGFIPNLRQTLARTGADPRQIEMEITEAMLLHDAEACIASLSALRELDIRLILDEFGTGYSSLSNLHRFPVQAVKIDRYFITESVRASDGVNLVRAIIEMTHCLGRKVVAMGLETQAQLDVLMRCGCDEAQGNLISPALPGDEVTEILNSESWRPLKTY
ncbi:MAG: EAL domain-containing protein, partial [Alphaproteobacteria bacterium]|nr:EAL domain-containing protein [Alphaproteobacteria bacterium]